MELDLDVLVLILFPCGVGVLQIVGAFASDTNGLVTFLFKKKL